MAYSFVEHKIKYYLGKYIDGIDRSTLNLNLNVTLIQPNFVSL